MSNNNNDTSADHTPFDAVLKDLLRCPASGQALVLADDGKTLYTQDQQFSYPLVGDIPWLLANPDNSLLDWGAKLHHFNQVLAHEIKTLEVQLPQTTGETQQRLQKLLDGKQNFLRRVAELMMPVVATPVAEKRVYDALRDKAPSTQNLLSYEANLYRDWAWGDDENRLTADIVMRYMPSKTRCLVLGAGAGRLAYDIHRQSQSSLTIATDINPLLLFAAKHIIRGGDLQIYEFPLHPRSVNDVAVLHEIHGAEPVDNFHFIFCDANKPVFAHAGFDCVLTPWFIDIQPLEFSQFVRQLNQYLTVGGQWINFGSLVFNQNRDAFCYSIDEVKHIAADHGFTIENIEQHEIPYLKSPHNAGYRMEHVWSWTARKTADVPALQDPQVLPAWLLDPRQPIPKAAYLEQFAFTYRIYAQLAAEVDGRTSVEKIGKKLARQNKMDEREGVQMVVNFFLDLHSQNVR